MSGIKIDAFKEGMSKVETGKEMKSNLENVDLSEVKEISEAQKKIEQEADTETAKNSSLSSLLEDNKDKRGGQENKFSESDERRAGIIDEQKEKLHELTSWSDEILDAIGSGKEAVIYMKEGLKEVEINGKKCLVRDDIDLEQEDEDGITNRERMERGRPPTTKDGEEVELHHIGQKQNSPLAELTMEQHRGVGNDTILHDKTKETEIDRNKFGKERRDHWLDRVESMKGVE